jgi:hypothetical protein
MVFPRGSIRSAVKNKYNILLGQLGRRGDCLYATTIARQIKQDYPGCRLTWAISSLYRTIIDGNPFVDEIWEIEQCTAESADETWNKFYLVAMAKKKSGQYDDVFFTQVPPSNFQNYDGTSRSSIFRGYPHSITVPIQPVIRLFDTEVQNVKTFIANNHILPHDIVVLFECASTSGQSHVTPEFAFQTAQMVTQRNNRIKFILTSDKSISQQLPNIIDGSTLTFRENAELTHSCALLVGCSSGISWLATSDWAKPIPQVQLLKKTTRMYASMLSDAEYFHLPTDHILEIVDASSEYVAKILLHILEQGFDAARNKYQQINPLIFDFYLTQINHELLSKKMYLKAAQAIGTAFVRYQYDKNGIEELNKTIKKILTPYVKAHWNKMSEEEKIAFNDIGVIISIHNYASAWCISVFQLFVYSIFGSRTRIARHLFLTTLQHLKRGQSE